MIRMIRDTSTVTRFIATAGKRRAAVPKINEVHDERQDAWRSLVENLKLAEDGMYAECLLKHGIVELNPMVYGVEYAQILPCTYIDGVCTIVGIERDRMAA